MHKLKGIVCTISHFCPPAATAVAHRVPWESISSATFNIKLFAMSTHTGITEAVLRYQPSHPQVKEFEPPKDRAFLADPAKRSLLTSTAKVKNLTPYLGTELVGIQLSQLTDSQKDELALLVAEVGESTFDMMEYGVD